MPVRSASATRATALASTARASPVSSRAATRRVAGRPAMTSRRSASRAAETWKYMATPARNPAAHPAVVVSTAGPPPAPRAVARRRRARPRPPPRTPAVPAPGPGGSPGCGRSRPGTGGRTGRWSSRHRPPVADLDDAVEAVLVDDEVADDQHTAAGVPPLGDQRPELLVGVPVEAGVRLVQQQHVRVGQQGQAKVELGQGAAGELVGAGASRSARNPARRRWRPGTPLGRTASSGTRGRTARNARRRSAGRTPAAPAGSSPAGRRGSRCPRPRRAPRPGSSSGWTCPTRSRRPGRPPHPAPSQVRAPQHPLPAAQRPHPASVGLLDAHRGQDHHYRRARPRR